MLAGSSVDAYNPKTVRASVGSLFHLPLAVEPDVAAAVAAARAAGLTVLAADGDGEVVLDDADDLLRRPDRLAAAATRPGGWRPRSPRPRTTGSGSPSTVRPRASTSPRPRRCACTRRHARSAPRADLARRRPATRVARVSIPPGDHGAGGRPDPVDTLPDGIVVADRTGHVTLAQHGRRADARHRAATRPPGSRSSRCSPSWTAPATPGARSTCRTAACRPAPASPSSPGCWPTARRSWSPPPSTGSRPGER